MNLHIGSHEYSNDGGFKDCYVRGGSSSGDSSSSGGGVDVGGGYGY